MSARVPSKTVVGVFAAARLHAGPAAAEDAPRTVLGGRTSANAFLWEKGVMTELPGLRGSQAAAVGISARGQIVGVAETADGEFRAVMWEEGAITDLGSLGGGNGAAYSVNARGTACG